MKKIENQINLRNLFGIIGFGIIFSGTNAQADVASQFCKSKGGEVRLYTLKDQGGNLNEVELCWFRGGAIGTWTFYNFHHVARSASTVEEFINDNNLTLTAVQAFFVNPRTGPNVEAEPQITIHPAASGSSGAHTALPGASPAGLKEHQGSGLPTKSVDERLASEITNPSFQHCFMMGGQPFRLNMVTPGDGSPRTLERKDNPYAAVCYFDNNSAIEIWSLFWGPDYEDLSRETAESRRPTEDLAEALLGDY